MCGTQIAWILHRSEGGLVQYISPPPKTLSTGRAQTTHISYSRVKTVNYLIAEEIKSTVKYLKTCWLGLEKVAIQE